jgi:phosphoesterase RecJ-like protein
MEKNHVTLQQIADILRGHKKFAIVGHISPDGDAIGACMGLALSLAKIGKNPVVLLEPYLSKYDVIPGRHFLWHEALDMLDAEVLIALDCADADRMGPARTLLDTVPVTICIDHHETNAGFARFNYIDKDASSSSEIIFDLVTLLAEMDVDIASAIYAGVVSDTGGFRFSATGKTTLVNSARMMEMGIPFTKIYSELMNQHSFDSAKALGVVIHNTRQALDGRITYSHATREDLAKVGVKPSDLDSTAEFLMNTRGTELALFIYEKDNAPEVKVSLRSHELHVGQFAARWGGGGHRLAAGCTLTDPINEILPKVLAALESELLANG